MEPAAVGKKELAAELGWSRPRLDRRLNEDPAFPVLSRGDQAGGWRFDVAAVRRHLGTVPPSEAASATRAGKPERRTTAPAAIDEAQLRDAVKPAPPATAEAFPRRDRRSAHHQGEATARQRKDLADALLREDKLGRERGELVARGELRQLLSATVAQLSRDLDALPETIVRDFALPDAAIPAIRQAIDKARADMVRRLAGLLADDGAA